MNTFSTGEKILKLLHKLEELTQDQDEVQEIVKTCKDLLTQKIIENKEREKNDFTKDYGDFLKGVHDFMVEKTGLDIMMLVSTPDDYEPNENLTIGCMNGNKIVGHLLALLKHIPGIVEEFNDCLKKAGMMLVNIIPEDK